MNIRWMPLPVVRKRFLAGSLEERDIAQEVDRLERSYSAWRIRKNMKTSFKLKLLRQSDPNFDENEARTWINAGYITSGFIEGGLIAAIPSYAISSWASSLVHPGLTFAICEIATTALLCRGRFGLVRSENLQALIDNYPRL